MTLRILDFNVWSGLTYLGAFEMGNYGGGEFIERRLEFAVEQIKRLDPDLVCLHELNPSPEIPRRLARSLNMDFYAKIHLSGIRLGPVGIPRNLREADGIFIKKGIRFSPLGKRKLSGGWVGEHASFNTTDASQVLGIRLEWEGKSICLFTTHWHAGVERGPDIEKRAAEIEKNKEASAAAVHKALRMLDDNVKTRMMEARRTLEFIGRFDCPRVILTGDFNSNPHSKEIGKILSAGFSDSYAVCHPGEFGATWDYASNVNHQKFYSEHDENLYLRLNYTRLKMPHRLDYIFSRGAIRAVSSEIVLKEEKDGLLASDHFGVMTSFEI